MVADQLERRGIRDPQVLSAFARVLRHRFVPEPQRGKSYGDHPLSIGEGQTISQPYIVALMTELLSVRLEARILEVGTGSGYQTAILAEIAGKVYSIERIPELAEGASHRLEELGYRNVEIRIGDGTLGWPEEAPFDGILVTASAPGVPETLKRQLSDGGRLVIPIGQNLDQTLTLVERSGEGFQMRAVCSCVFVPLIGAYGFDPNDR